MRPYSPGGAFNALATRQKGSNPPTSNAHRLQPGLPGYLIPFAPLAFVHQRQNLSSDSLSPLVFYSISTHFTATPSIPVTSPDLEPGSFGCRSGVKLRDFTSDLHGPPTHPLRPVNPNNAWHLCITAAAGTELAVPSSPGTIRLRRIRSERLIPSDRGLQAEALHPPRGVAPSGLPPLRKILDCCHP